ncbi:MAG TPA: CcdB family protein [Chakrabartia sp.]|jgi:toxin CcdB|nr:CcdB family protein [Chakrabartia sp.]
MAQFDVHKLPGKGGLVVNCQSDFLSDYETRFVIPLFAVETGAIPASRLNPRLIVEGRAMLLYTQYGGAVKRTALGPAIASLDADHLEIKAALDMLISGI